MPKENTHLMFARNLSANIRETKMKDAITSHTDLYLLGSIIPDTFFYSSNNSIENISQMFHGKGGRPTNLIILSVLEQARGMNDVAFILGYITHCALDITFHPMIDSLSGDYYDADPAKREQAMYMHRSLETCIDARMQNSLRLSSIVRPRMLKSLVFEDIVSRDFRTSPRMIEFTLGKQILLNMLFASVPAYHLARSLYDLKIVKSKSLLALFYGDVKNSNTCIEDPIRYRDTLTGSEIVESLSALFARARAKALPMMEAAWGFSQGSVSREELLKFIPGENLSTGAFPTAFGAA